MNGMHDFNAGNRTPRRPKGLEPEQGTREPFHCSMVLLYNIIEVFTVPNDNCGLVPLVIVPNRCGIRTTLIDGDFFWESLSPNRLVQESLGRGSISVWRQQKINRIARFVDGAVQIRCFPESLASLVESFHFALAAWRVSRVSVRPTF